MSKKSDLLLERTTFKPFNYPWAYDAWLTHEQSHWLHTEVSMQEDVVDWKNKLSKEEKQFLTNIFRFFTQGDVDVAGGSKLQLRSGSNKKKSNSCQWWNRRI